MKIIRTDNRYGSGDNQSFLNRFNKDFDYLLFRQDWGGNESVYFNTDEIENVLEKIDEGEILIHHNYSILFCKTEDLLNEVDDLFGCYVTVIDK
jgi:hypothetical protein